jgi:ubiquinol-cytochrome c reductase iron-sulfur subunit
VPKAAGAPVEVDISKLKPGQMMTVEWRGKPVWIINRTKEMLETLKKTEGEVAIPSRMWPMQPEYAKNETRSIKGNHGGGRYLYPPRLFTVSDKFKTGADEGMPADWLGGFLCPCHGSTFDFAGRVYKIEACPDQSRSAAARVSFRYAYPDRRRQEGSIKMAGGTFEKYKSDGSIGGNVLEWVDARFPATSMWKGHLSEYYCPKNFNFWYFFGSLALLVLVIQIVTGIFLVMHYKPDASLNAVWRAGGLCFRRVHHARCARWLVDPLHALHRALRRFYRGVSAHVPWSALRFLPQAPRADLDLRHPDLPGADG